METVSGSLGLPWVKGDVGIEIEVEANEPLPESTRLAEWASERDGSLRGYSMEYITRGPLAIDAVDESLLRLNNRIQKCGIKHSFRAGVHVHLNVGHLSSTQLGNVIATYYCLEEALVKFCGENREGNHFCLRIKDAEYPLLMICDALRRQDLRQLSTDNLRYASLNLRAIPRYGSVEFRGMETRPDFDKIGDWCRILYKIRDYATNLSSREFIAFEISSEGPENWARSIFGEELFDRINFKGFEDSVVSCMRTAQDLIYLQEQPIRKPRKRVRKGEY